jgi:hypothetical protein
MNGQISVAAEVRLRSDLFGLTPGGPQQRRWMISDEDLERAGIILGDEVSDLREQRATPEVDNPIGLGVDGSPGSRG